MKWREFFPNKDLKELPYFDGRAVCYPKAKVVRDYLAWRQVDCKLFLCLLNVKFKQTFSMSPTQNSISDEMLKFPKCFLEKRISVTIY